MARRRGRDSATGRRERAGAGQDNHQFGFRTQDLARDGQQGFAQDVRGRIMKPLSLRIATLLLVLGVLLAPVGLAYLFPRPKKVVVDAAFYERFQLGMTEAEVDAVPIPPGDHSGACAFLTSEPTCEGGLPLYIDYHPRKDGAVSAPHPLTGRPLRGKWWRGKSGQVLIFFGDDHRVIERRWYPGRPLSWVEYHWDSLVR
jgi:hypothetical protein